MNNKQILDNAPEGATHVSDNGVYYFMNYPVAMNYWTRGQEWVESGGIHHLCRSLSEISEIESLREQLKTAKADGLIHFTKSEIKLPKHTKSQLFSNGYSTGVNDVIEAAVNYANKIKEQGE